VLARVETEWQHAAEGEGFVLPDVVVAGRVAALDRSRLHRVGGLQARDDVAGREQAELEFAVTELGDAIDEKLRRPPQRVEAPGEAGGHAPADARRLSMHGRRADDRSGGGQADRGAGCGAREDLATYHRVLLGGNLGRWEILAYRL
jgi:hypothetical protein